MYKCVFKEKRGAAIVLSMQLTSDGSEVEEVEVPESGHSRLSFASLSDRMSFLKSQRTKWQKGYDAASLFAGLVDTDALPPGAQAMADSFGLSEQDALIFYQTTKLASAPDFFDRVRGTVDNSELGI